MTPSESRSRVGPVRVGLAALLPFVVLLLPDGGPGSSVGPTSLLPALFAISLAFATARAIVPLAGGVWLGVSMLLWQGGLRWSAPFVALFESIRSFVVSNSIYRSPRSLFGCESDLWCAAVARSGGADHPELAVCGAEGVCELVPAGLSYGVQSFQLAVLGFVFVLIAMVTVVVRAGGIAGVADRFVVFARSARSTRLISFLLGLCVFFDDYANTLIVGGTMRPLADRMRISREKLAWIVDSTAAPVAGLSILSTWVAFEVSQFAPQLGVVGLDEAAGYSVFLQTVPYRFYCILSLVLVAVVCLTSRDFGPMLLAEQRAHRTGAVFRPGARPMSASGATDSEAKEGIPHLARVALIPIGTTVVSILALFWIQGESLHSTHVAAGLSFAHIQEVLEGVVDNTYLLFQGSCIGLFLAVFMALALRLLSVREVLTSVFSGSRTLGMAVGVLFLAWAMASVCKGLGTGEYLKLMAPHIPGVLLPLGLFLIACVISFATGSSWSTMGILLPIIIDLAASVGAGTPVGSMGMVIITIGAVLDGSIFGDHCSPISDTTLLSSAAAGSDHMDHVKTQAPYATVVMVVALLLGYLPVASGLSVWLALPISVMAIIGLVIVLGRRADA
jgi:Na+/H+ antiporter NhaC